MDHRNRARLVAALFAATMATPAAAHLSIIRQGPESTGTRLFGDRFGSTLVAGDFNGDGYDDLATAAVGENVGGNGNSGNVTINFGSYFGLTHVGAVDLDVSDFGFVPQVNAGFGTAMAVARLNDDDYDDLIVGAPFEDVNGVLDAGRVYFYAGGPSGLTPWFHFRQEDVGGVSLPGELFGYALLADDFDTTPGVELVIGSPSRDGDGKVFYIEGTEWGPFGATTFFDPDVLGYEAQAGDGFGFCLASGNLISDFRRDLVVGAPTRRIGADDDAGAVYIIRGTASGLSTTGDYVIDAGMTDEADPNAEFGSSLAVGKFRGPGLYDYLVIGEPYRTVGGVSRAGRIHGIRGSASGPDWASTAVFYQTDFGETNENSDAFGSTLAAGYFGVNDSSEDLVIGSPMEGGNSAPIPDVGACILLYGDPDGLGTVGWTYFYEQEQLGEKSEEGDRLGRAAVIGAFDHTNLGTLAVSADGEDEEKGLVHILAPWRQVYDYKCKSSIVVDCEDTIVFSQKPFESFPAANTSLAMVALIGCERALIPEGTEGHVPLDLEYVVPDWVAELSPGHDYLVAGETTNFRDLLYACIMTEGGDAGLAIADILYPGNHTISDMAYAMNQRAWELGMTSTNFTRPALFWESSGDAEDHHTSAYDLYLLARAAKENPLFDQIANTRSRHDVREFADQGPTITLMNNWFLMDLQDSIEKSSGIKKGWTEDSGTALLYTADGPSGGSAVVATLATPEYGEYGQTAIDMMELGLGQCFNLVAEQWNGDINYLSDGIYAVANETVGISGQFQVLSDDAQFELFFLPGGQVPEVMAEISVSHTSYLALDYLQSTTLGLSPLGADQGARVTNAGANNAAVRLNGTLHVIPPGESVSLPRREDLHYWEVENAGEIRAELVVEETYVHSLHYLNEDGEYPPDPIFTATMARREFVESDQFAYSIRWLTTGGQFVMALHDEQVTADAPGPPRGISTPALQVDAHTYPNPSWDRTSIAMRLSDAADVELDIYDASGRRVRHFPHEARLAGSATVEWDGRDDGGELLPPGVYFYRISLTKGEAEGEASPSGVGRVSVGGRIVRVR